MNLEWATPSENVKHAYLTGLCKIRKGKDSNNYGKTGEFNWRIKKVYQINKKGDIIGEFPSISIATIKTSITNISAACLGKLKTAGGFIWKFKEAV